MDTPEKYVYRISPIPVVFGILVIAAIYLLPIFPLDWLRGPVTLAHMNELCSSPFRLFRCPEGVSWIFLAGWMVGIIAILIGIFNRVKE